MNYLEIISKQKKIQENEILHFKHKDNEIARKIINKIWDKHKNYFICDEELTSNPGDYSTADTYYYNNKYYIIITNLYYFGAIEMRICLK